MSRILLLDDSSSVRDLVGHWLTTAGHQVTKRGSSRHVARLLRTTSFDLIITDIYMPEGDGLELLTLLRTKHPQIPCIAISSAEGELNLLPIAEKLGAVVTLRKPFAEADLNLATATALARTTAPTTTIPSASTAVTSH